MKNEQVLEAGTASRRMLLVGAGSVGAVAALAACGTESDSPSTSSGPGSDPTTGAPSTTGAQSAAPSAGGGDTAANAIAKTTDVPVGSGVILAEQQVVITQPAAGTFKCFSNVCTHQGCPVSSVDGGSIVCKCHNSLFSIEDGSPTSGPARQPLDEKQITVDGESITLA
ncbi:MULTISPECIES: Rieske (2Fe-2S) protein [Catenuloplanes]|uniref:Nitrite reductase/ring-hydroxylating ferredoxin subunit n=1 Tax=Catenuloplanes niger TaxID=587534 RepID=A0AAE3ZMN0_9ACTN|nr:Rieske (2Fe-2S) protein [Catenuloplanes niger]MDR7321425.1 nitrite reductase/ring-hydroxylating ferredoxin subunit [Catenuloplanes niger]